MSEDQFKQLLAAVMTQNILLEKLYQKTSGKESDETKARKDTLKLFCNQLRAIKQPNWPEET